MKKMIYVGLSAALGFAALGGPAMAATGSLAPGQVPYCSSTTGQEEMQRGDYAGQLQRPGQTIASLEIWNGCVKVIYSDATGHSSTAIYDPDTLQLLKSMGDDGSQG
jgi:hypothetical protein